MPKKPGFQPHAESEFLFERAENVVFHRALDSAETVAVRVIEIGHAFVVNVAIDHRGADLEPIGDAVFHFGVEIEGAIGAFILALAHRAELVKIEVPARQSFGAANPAEEVFVGL